MDSLKPELSPRKNNLGVDLEALTDALFAADALSVEVKLVLGLAREIGAAARQLRYSDIQAVTPMARASLIAAVRAAEAHQLIVVDRSTDPFTYQIAERYRSTPT